MYILKNAWRSICRGKGRAILIALIVFVVAFAACIGLSIRQAAESAKTQGLESLTITAQITMDRSALMNNASEDGGGFDRDAFKENFSGMQQLSAEELQTYAAAESVSGFYYTATVSMDGNDAIEAVESTVSAPGGESSGGDSSAGASGSMGGFPGMDGEENGKGGGRFSGGMGTQGDFTLIGYSSYDAMTDFVNGTSTISDGTIFEEDSADWTCVISDELATYNSLAVGDAITLINPNNTEESYTLTISGIYTNSQSTASSGGAMMGFSAASDPANQILMSSAAVEALVAQSEAAATVTTDETTGQETTTALAKQISGTYLFGDIDAYEQFEDQAHALGLSNDYTVTSSDLTSYEQSLLPLENLSKMALWFLLVVLAIGAVILIVINIFNVRERKYEVGVLAAIGMKKGKIALQFLYESLIITVAAIVMAGAAGVVVSVPVTNLLLENQIESQSTSQTRVENAFGKSMEDMGGMPGGSRPNGGSQDGAATPEVPADGFSGMFDTSNQYVSEVTSAANLTVVVQLFLIGILLALLASAVSIIFVLRYEPMRILANRD
ncbi:MAG: ABC transporter permease [Candidatus Howiella sp.]|jgi:putative ABC transport system permease protein